jgi:hypothetical protein
MTDLPVCRWREHRRDGALYCRSEKYVGPPNRVDADFCLSCGYRDHEPAAKAIGNCLPAAAGARIAVATLYTPEIADIGVLTSEVLCAYAARHGYAALIATRLIDESRPASWSKLLLVEHYLARTPSCEWVMWIDADAVVTNPAQKVEDLIDQEVDFLAAEDLPPSPINLGVFLVRNCPAALDLLRRAYAKVQYIHHPWWEQPAVAEALRESGARLRSRVVSRRLFNSFAGEHQEGDFILHFAGCPREMKLAGLRKAVPAALAAARNCPDFAGTAIFPR